MGLRYFLRKNKKGMSTMEFTWLMAIGASALLLMQPLAQYSIQGRVASDLQSIEDRLYDPRTASATTRETMQAKTITTIRSTVVGNKIETTRDDSSFVLQNSTSQNSVPLN